MTVSGDSSSAVSTNSETKNTINGDDRSSKKKKKSKAKSKTKSKSSEHESAGSSKSEGTSTELELAANEGDSASEAPLSNVKKKATKVSVARTSSGSGADLPPRSPMKRAKSSSPSAAQNTQKTNRAPVKPSSLKAEQKYSSEVVLLKPKSMTDLGDSKPNTRRRASKKSPVTSPSSSVAAAAHASGDSANNLAKAKLQVQEKMADQEFADSSSKTNSAKRASMPNTPSKTRVSLRHQMNVQEETISAKMAASKNGGDGTAKGVSTTSQTPPPPAEPGAYRVQGQNVARTPSGLLSPQTKPAPSSSSSPPHGARGLNGVLSRPNAISSPHSPTRTSQAAVSTGNRIPRALLPGDPPSPVAGVSPQSVAPTQVKVSKSAKQNLIVAAELSDDIEAHIEDEVRRRIMAEAAKAQIVSVAHGIPMLDPKEEARRLADLRELHKPRGVREKLFGDSRNADIDMASSPESIRKRNYLKWTLKRNQATGLWVTTVQTKQKAVEQHDVIEVERTSVSFSATTQQEAFETGLANAVPMMQPTEEHPICYVCKAKFALFRRPQHCKNCGVCICSSCTKQWPGKMFPETYNAKTINNVCTACDWLANSFRDALVDGNYRTALHLYATGNVHIRAPFCLDKKAEVM